ASVVVTGLFVFILFDGGGVVSWGTRLSFFRSGGKNFPRFPFGRSGGGGGGGGGGSFSSMGGGGKSIRFTSIITSSFCSFGLSLSKSLGVNIATRKIDVPMIVAFVTAALYPLRRAYAPYDLLRFANTISSSDASRANSDMILFC